MPDAVLPWQALGGDAAAATASFTVTLTMVSDWHIGTGAGIPGSVDRVIVRDDRGLPMVPAKTLTGVWRDACELVALGLDDGAGNGGWCRLVEAVFGDQPALREEATGDPPRPAALSVRPARLPDGLRAALAPGAAAPFRDALTFVKPGVEIDPDSGRARTKSLRMEEVARRGAVLTAPCTLDLPTADPALRNAAAALLIAGAAVALTQIDLVAWGWLDWLIDLLGGVAALVLAILLFPAVAGIITSFFLEDVAAAVERRHYPGLPPPRPQGVSEGITTALQFAGILLLFNGVAFFVAYWIPVLNTVIFYLVNGYLLGREYFEMVALRRRPPAEMRQVRGRHGSRLLTAGILIALMLSVPLLNLLTPIVATAFMVHVHQRIGEVEMRRRLAGTG